MLHDIRERFIGTTGKIILAVILLLLAGTGLNYTLTPNRFVAKVDGEEVSLRAVNNAFNSQVANFGDADLPAAFLDQIRASAVESVISRTALQQYLSNEGFAVSDEMIANTIVSNPAFQTDGKFDRELYDRLLASNQFSAAGYEASQRGQMVINQFQETLTNSAFITPSEFRRRIELTGQQREVEYATISPDTYLEEVSVSEEDVMAWYENNPTRFTTPASVDLEYLLIDESVARARIDVTDDLLLAYYEGIQGEYEGEEQRRASHILLNEGDDALAAELLERVNAGESFEALAEEFSVDGGSAANGGDLGFVAKGNFTGPVEDAVYAMSVGELSGVVESQFGLHIIRLDDIRTGDAPDFETVRADVTERFYADRTDGELAAIRSELDDQYFENATFEAMAAALGVELQATADFTAESILPFGREPALQETVFGPGALEAGQPSEPVSLADDRTAVVRVVARKPAGRQPLAEVQEDIRELLRTEAADAIAAERGAQLAGALRAEPNMDFETLTLNTGAEVTERRYIERSDTQVPAALAAAVFNAPLPDGAPRVGSVNAPGSGFLIYRVSDVKPGSVPDLPQAQIDAGRRQLAAQNGTAQVLAIVSTLRDEADVEMGDLLETTQGL